MTELLKHGQKVETVFELLGDSENAMTYSLGWALAKCNGFCQSLAALLGISQGFSDSMHIRLQEHQKEKGFTDIEIIDPGKYHIIIEAKCGFNIPSIQQLEKYADRLNSNQIQSVQKILVILAESDREEKWLFLNTPKAISGVQVKAISWNKFQVMAKQSLETPNHEEKRLLRQLLDYLSKVTSMQKQNSNMVYVVALSNGESGVGGITNIELVEKYRKYFHPVGGGKGGWPVNPPNYIAFRYNGALQSIHHIERYTVIDDFKDVLDGCAGSGKVERHYLYSLGTSILPSKRIQTNDTEGKFPKIVQAARKHCFIDLLLTCNSIAEAAYKSRERENKLDAA